MAYKAVIIGGKHSGQEFQLNRLWGSIQAVHGESPEDFEICTYHRQPTVSKIKDGDVVFYAPEHR